VPRSVSLDTLSASRGSSGPEAGKSDSGCARDGGLVPKERLGMMEKAR